MRPERRTLWLWTVTSLMNIAACCSPFNGDSNARMQVLQAMSGIANHQGSVADAPRARGKETFSRGFSPSSAFALGVSSMRPVSDSSELSCSDFDSTCRWRNIEGLFVDEMDWFQGTGVLNRSRIQRATGANTIPDGSYAIVATDTVKPSTAKAVMAADPIPCQLGPGQLSFKYWTSPQVHLRVCLKRNPRSVVDFDYCSNVIEIGDPGPVSVRIPEPTSLPFQLFIVADHFVFDASDLQGGFAIIDDIEYTADICSYLDRNPDIQPNHFFRNPSTDSPLRPATKTGWDDAETVPGDDITPMRQLRI